MENVDASKVIILSSGNVFSLDRTIPLLQVVWLELFFSITLVCLAQMAVLVALLRMFACNADQNSPTTLLLFHARKIVGMDFASHFLVMITIMLMEMAVVLIVRLNPSILVLEDLQTPKTHARRHCPTKSQ